MEEIASASRGRPAPGRPAGAGGFWAVVLVFLGALLAAQIRQRPAGLQTPADEFSAARAAAVLERIAVEPHPLGSPAGRRVAEFLVAELERIGWRAELIESYGPPTLLNVHARLEPQDGPHAEPLLFMAHHDSTPRGPGAGDDGIAIAALVEAARALSAGSTATSRPIELLLTDGEESGMRGSKAFLHDLPRPLPYAAVINVEAVGNRGPSVLFQSAGCDGGLIRALAAAAPRPAGSSILRFVFGLLPNDTDFTQYERAGASGLNLAVVGGSTAYHAAFDTPANLDRGSLQELGETLLGLARGLAAEDSTPQAPARVFHAVGGRWMLHAPAAGARWIALAAAFAVALLIVARARVPELLFGAAAAAGLIVLAAGLGALLQLALDAVAGLAAPAFGSARPRGDAHSAALSGAGFVLLAAYAARLGTGSLPRRMLSAGLDGGLLLWCALVGGLALAEPTAALALAPALLAGTLSKAACERQARREASGRSMAALGTLASGLAALWLAALWIGVVQLTSLRPAVMAAVGCGSLALGLPLAGSGLLSAVGSTVARRSRAALAVGPAFALGLGLALSIAAALGRALGW